MKVHIYARDFPPSGSRSGAGVNKAVSGLANGFAMNGARVTVVCNGTADASGTVQPGYDVRCFPQTKGVRGELDPGLLDYVGKCDPSDVFLLNGVFTPATYQMSRACLRKGIPYVFWPHDPYHPNLFKVRRYRKWAYWHLYEKRLLRDAAAVQILNADQKFWLSRRGLDVPCVEMVNGYAPEDVIASPNAESDLSAPERLLFLGRLDSHNKGLDILLDAFASVAGKTEAKLTLQGPDWGDRKGLEKRALAVGLDETRVAFKAPDFTKSASEIMKEHDAILLPSRFEGFSLAALEAMCSARVMMVSDVNGIASHVKASGCGVVVTPDVESVARGLLDLLSMRRNWLSMGLAGQSYAMQHFRWEDIASKLLHEYRRIAKARHRAPGR